MIDFNRLRDAYRGVHFEFIIHGEEDGEEADYAVVAIHDGEIYTKAGNDIDECLTGVLKELVEDRKRVLAETATPTSTA